MSAGRTPALRVRTLNEAPLRDDGRYVLYWMVANRRTTFNFSLDRAIDLAREHDRPLVVLEPLRCGYRWASDRLHRFVLQGMADNAESFADSPVRYHPWVETEAGAGKGLLAAMAAEACVVVTDDYPCFFIPAMLRAAAGKLSVRLEAVDSNGLLPLRAAERVFPTAHSFRRFLQKTLRDHLGELPRMRPLARLELPVLDGPPAGAERWAAAGEEALGAGDAFLARLPIDHEVGAVSTPGGQAAARARLRRFLHDGLDRYAEDANHPDEHATSELSPYLHFGQISSHEIFRGLARHEDWSTERLGRKTDGSRRGWWGMSESAEAFVDQLVTWRELGFNMAWQRDDHDEFDSLPPWARETLAQHERDRREHVYTLEQLERARTHDPLWNAAQTELAREGRLHNYLRMLWGKKILEWSPSPREAAEIMVSLNDRYALDGRDPNSYSGIFWVLGRYDRAWGPERPVFGKIRYMSSANTARKLRLREYLKQYGSAGAREADRA